VSAMQQAQTRLLNELEDLHRQIDQLKSKNQSAMTEVGAKMHRIALEKLDRREQDIMRQQPVLHDRLAERRDDAISRFTPLLMQSVRDMDSAYWKLVSVQGGHAAIRQIADYCVNINERAQQAGERRTGGRRLLQPVDEKDATSGEALVALRELGLQGKAVLDELGTLIVDNARRDPSGKEVKYVPSPVKSIERSIQKVQEDYGGDYTRLLDLVRATIIFPSCESLARGIEFLFSKERLSGIEVGRAKDRISATYDAEASGGNRDVLLNVWIRVGDRDMVGEVQFHLKPLFSLKHDLHLLYTGARVLGVTDDSIAVHEGDLTDRAVERATRGIIRRLRCDYSDVVDAEIVATLLRLESLLEFHLAGTTADPSALSAGGAFMKRGLTLRYLLVPNDSAQSAATGQLLSSRRFLGGVPPRVSSSLLCTRLRVLNLSRRGLQGDIPRELGDCRFLITLKLNNNHLSGVIPREIGRLEVLKLLGLNCNQLSGPIPDELSSCRRLMQLSLDDNKLSGAIPPELGECKMLSHIYLQKNQLVGIFPPKFAKLPNLEQLNLSGNKLSGPLPPPNIADAVGKKLTKLFLADNDCELGLLPAELRAQLKRTDVPESKSAAAQT